MKILSVADIHINLHKKKVPYQWQFDRYTELFDKLLKLESQTDVTVIAGDIFDKKPETDEICLFLSYVNQIQNPTIAIPGNHEATAKGKTFLEHFTRDNAINNPNFHLFTENGRLEIKGVGFQAFPYGEMQLDKLPPYVKGDILITHIRGEVPPHITPEYDFGKLSPWGLVLLGDLHFRHQYKNYPIYYPGSPLNTSFDRNEERSYGVDIIDFASDDTYTVNFVDLELPKLIRKTITADEELKPIPPHHVVYEIKGSIDSLSKVKNHELLDKKIIDKTNNKSKLQLDNMTLQDELNAYLKHINTTDDGIVSYFSSLGIN